MVDSTPKKSNAFVTSTLYVSLGLILGRISGLLRDLIVANKFGVSAEADIISLLLTIPDFLVLLLVSGGLSAALIPEFHKLNPKQNKGLLGQSSILVFLFSSLIALVLYIGVDYLVMLFAPGFDATRSLQLAQFVSMVLFIIPFNSLSGVTTAYLQANSHFAVPAMGSLMFNSFVIVGLLLTISGFSSIETLVLFVIIGSLVRWLSQVVICSPIAVVKNTFHENLINRQLIKKYLQAMLGVGLLIFYSVIARAFASYGEVGTVAMFNYTTKLVDLPTGVISAMFSVVLFPHLSSAFAKGNKEDFSSSLINSIIYVVGFALLVVLPTVYFAEEIISLIYGWGSLTQDKLQEMANALKMAIFYMIPQVIAFQAIAAFNASSNTKIPVITIGLSLLLFVGLCTFYKDDLDIFRIMVLINISSLFMIFMQFIYLYKILDISIFEIRISKNKFYIYCWIVLTNFVAFSLIDQYFDNIFYIAASVFVVSAISIAVVTISYFKMTKDLKAHSHND